MSKAQKAAAQIRRVGEVVKSFGRAFHTTAAAMAEIERLLFASDAEVIAILQARIAGLPDYQRAKLLRIRRTLYYRQFRRFLASLIIELERESEALDVRGPYALSSELPSCLRRFFTPRPPLDLRAHNNLPPVREWPNGLPVEAGLMPFPTSFLMSPAV